MMIGFNFYFIDYFRFKFVFIYGCLGINYLFLELIESNVMVNLVIIMMIGCFDYILINYSKFFLMVENRIVVVLLEV